MGVRQNVQCQVIIGNDVVEVYDEVKALLGDNVSNTEEAPKQNKN